MAQSFTDYVEREQGGGEGQIGVDGSPEPSYLLRTWFVQFLTEFHCGNLGVCLFFFNKFRRLKC